MLQVTIVDSNYNRIDAWGTIKTTFGEFPCLRIRQDHTTDVYSRAGLKLLTFELNVNYFWITNDYGIVATVTGINGVIDPNYDLAKSVNVMTNYSTKVCDLCRFVIPDQFVLLQNYPNPFNPRTTFQYHLNKMSDVKLTVFNLAGQQVDLLVNDNQRPGIYKIIWDAGHLPSGMYVYLLEMQGNVLTNNCMLVK